jgi:hypothetical protein
VDREAPNYLEEYNKVRQKAKEAAGVPVESKEEKEENERREASDRH